MLRPEIHPPPPSPRCFALRFTQLFLGLGASPSCPPNSSQPKVLCPEVHPTFPRPRCFALMSTQLLPAQGALPWASPYFSQPKVLCLSEVHPLPPSLRCSSPWGSPTSSQPEVLLPKVHSPPPSPRCFALRFTHLLPTRGASPWGSQSSSKPELLCPEVYPPPPSLSCFAGPSTPSQPKVLCLRFTHLLPAQGALSWGSPTPSQPDLLKSEVHPPPPSPRCFSWGSPNFSQSEGMPTLSSPMLPVYQNLMFNWMFVLFLQNRGCYVQSLLRSLKRGRGAINRGQAIARNWGRPPGYRFPKLHSPIENFIVPLKNKKTNKLPRLS